jgi:hypothetical protein
VPVIVPKKLNYTGTNTVNRTGESKFCAVFFAMLTFSGLDYVFVKLITENQYNVRYADPDPAFLTNADPAPG